MNLLLVSPTELDPNGRAEVTGRRAEHIRRILKKGVGDRLRVGVVDGLRGAGIIEAVGRESVIVRVSLDERPPAKRPLVLVLALPRPPVARRVVQHATAIGVSRMVLIHSERVEKSYWHSPAMSEAALENDARLGLEQSGDTVLPTIERRPRFRAFVEDELPGLVAGSSGFLADPGAASRCPADVAGAVIIAVGPEGGFVPDEVARLQAAGLVAVGLGPRILRVETAVVALLARLGLS